MSKFSDKFIDGMSLVAEKVDENKFLGAIKDSFTIYMPFVIVGSFMSLFNTILCSTTTGLAKWVPALEALKPIFTAANFATLSCMTLPHRVPDWPQVGQEKQCAGAYLCHHGTGFLPDHLPADRFCGGGRQDRYR